MNEKNILIKNDDDDDEEEEISFDDLVSEDNNDTSKKMVINENDDDDDEEEECSFDDIVAAEENTSTTVEKEEENFLKDKKPPKKKRLQSLDILRGMTVILMIVVNNQPGADTFWWADHAEFNGVTPTDFIFPFFLWIMGYAMGIVFDRKIKSPNKIIKKKFWPFKKEFKMKNKTWENIKKWFKIRWFAGLLGVYFNFRIVRILGVLQRISICYFIVSLILNFTKWIKTQIFIVLILHSIYILFMFFIPNYCGVGVITKECSGQSIIDQLLLGKSHIWKETSTYDPEGVLSTFTAITTTYIGVLYFQISKYVKLKYKSNHYYLLTFWMLFSILLILIGFILNSYLFPYNKHIWSSAFVFLTAGTAGFFLSIITFIVDINNIKFWIYIFVCVGINPLFMYVIPSYVETFLYMIPVSRNEKLYNWLYRILFYSWIRNHKFANLIFGIIFETCFIGFAIFFYIKKIYIKL